MNESRVRQVAVLVGHALVVWILCGALVGLGRAFTSMENTLILHAVGAPLGAALVAARYFRRSGFGSPMLAAALFTGVPLALDLALVAPLMVGSFEMFASPLGTWIPLGSIFVCTWLVGALHRRSPRASAAA